MPERDLVFLMPELGDSDYRRAIDGQLDICAHMIVVTSARDHVSRPG